MSNVLSDAEIKEVLNFKVVAVVGCSPKEERPSHQIASYLKQAGYTVIPVNPGHEIILDERCYPNLLQIPKTAGVEIVNIFRRSEQVFPVVKEAVQIGAKAIWMQDGVEHPAAEKMAREAGLKVVSNDCIFRQHQRLQGPFRKNITTC